MKLLTCSQVFAEMLYQVLSWGRNPVLVGFFYAAEEERITIRDSAVVNMLCNSILTTRNKIHLSSGKVHHKFLVSK